MITESLTYAELTERFINNLLNAKNMDTVIPEEYRIFVNPKYFDEIRFIDGE